MNRKKIWELYAQSWNTSDRQEKLELFGKCLSPQFEYQDPVGEATGFDALADYMMDFHQQVPGGHFVTVDFKTHGDKSIAAWELLDGEGQKLGIGYGFGQYGDDGLLLSDVGFFDVPGGGAASG